jgi:hypothetical protein
MHGRPATAALLLTALGLAGGLLAGVPSAAAAAGPETIYTVAGGPTAATGGCASCAARPVAAAPAAQLNADAGTGTGLAGTSVATETCGQVSPLKLRKTCWAYWI